MTPVDEIDPNPAPPAEPDDIEMVPAADVAEEVPDPPERENQDYPELDERGQWIVPKEEAPVDE